MMFGWLFGVILILIVIWYFIQDRFNFPSKNTGRKDTERDVLDKRYARGEITKEEFEEQKRILRK